MKTYKLLSDPNAPEWNVKFVGAIAVAALVVTAGLGVFAYRTWGAEPPAAAPAAAVSEDAPRAEQRACTAEEVAAETARLGATSLPAGHESLSGCVIR